MSTLFFYENHSHPPRPTLTNNKKEVSPMSNLNFGSGLLLWLLGVPLPLILIIALLWR
jgi:hypothetical protein